MSSALAIAGVTAVLKDLLDSGMIDHKVTDAMGQGVTVSAIAPDAIQLSNDAKPRLNLFLHQVTPNAAWRNVDYPSRDTAGQRIGNPPLALDLHYLLTAYGNADLQAEVLLGYAMLLLHETPVLVRNAIRTALNPPTPPVTGSLLPTVYQALRASDLADQIEQIKITPAAMNTEEMSKLWTALQAHYRPTAPYQVSVVLIESRKPKRSPLPVLSRGEIDPVTKRERGVVVQATMIPPVAEIEEVTFSSQQNAAVLGDTITLKGHDLDGSGHTLILANSRLGIQNAITPAANVTPSAVDFVLPTDPVNYPAGPYEITLQVVRGTPPALRATNTVPLTIAPQVTLPPTANLDPSGDLSLTPTCSPNLRPNQQVSLILGGVEAFAEPFTTPTSTPTFVFRKLPTGAYWVRLRVDGVESLLVSIAPPPPSFSGPQIQVLP